MKWNKKIVDDILKGTDSIADFIVRLYKAVYKDKWDKIEKVIGFPKCGKELGKYLFEKAIELDNTHLHSGSAKLSWMNHGFSTVNNLGDWTVKPAPAKYKEQE
jgi:hypothetical protein